MSQGTNSLFSLTDIFESNLIDTNANLEENSEKEEYFNKIDLNTNTKENLNNINKGNESDSESEANISDLNENINEQNNIFTIFKDNKNFSFFNLEKFCNEVNLSKINKIFGEELDENYRKNKDNLNKIFDDSKEVNKEFDSDIKGKKIKRKIKRKNNYNLNN